MKRTTHTCTSLKCWMSHGDWCLKPSLPLDMGRSCAEPLHHDGPHSYTVRMKPKINWLDPKVIWASTRVGLLGALAMGGYLWFT